MPASMMAASQIMMGMGCHSWDTKMYHFGVDFSGSCVGNGYVNWAKPTRTRDRTKQHR
jgi:hypothetical protein